VNSIDYATFRTTIYKARKEHQCSMCRHVIAVGERYTVYVGLSDYQFSVLKLCKNCEGIFNG
jgi:hypothetical protein